MSPCTSGSSRAASASSHRGIRRTPGSLYELLPSALLCRLSDERKLCLSILLDASIKIAAYECVESRFAPSSFWERIRRFEGPTSVLSSPRRNFHRGLDGGRTASFLSRGDGMVRALGLHHALSRRVQSLDAGVVFKNGLLVDGFARKYSACKADMGNKSPPRSAKRPISAPRDASRAYRDGFFEHDSGWASTRTRFLNATRIAPS